ncbi:MAG: 4-alpha-glucanotransferase [Rhodocyclales bacterium]|nr:4-alpha-glucanotransferase [Rhodocyclales bacterium]
MNKGEGRLPRASGVLLHPTSLPGPHGSGDFGPAAYHFVDWLVTAGQRLWQILPLGGIGPGNSPYMSSSAFAGNVLLIDLAELQQQGWLDESDLAPVDGFMDHHLNFAAVVPFRMGCLARAAARFAEASDAANNEAFAVFCEQNANWLEDYALFMSLADAHAWQDWCSWGEPLARRKPAALRNARKKHAERIVFWKFCQWCFFRQWRNLKHYANQRGVEIVGDAPIFIAYQSAEVWARQDLFELDATGRPTVVAGVPPDLFSATGQHWGNPLYRWKAHADENYAWWVERIRRTFELVDIVRIDHFRGFAAYWEILASETTAINGRWMPGPGKSLFDAITDALGPVKVIAEDLGIITADVEALRRDCAFPGMRIYQFAFGSGNDNIYLSHNHDHDAVVYTGTHDNDTTLGWWSQANDGERHHVLEYLASDGGEIHWDLIRAACASVADTAIHPLQDVLGLGSEARMNFPGKAQGYWEWRFSWSQVHDWHAKRLSALCNLFQR